jgi:hypothetical protein
MAISPNPPRVGTQQSSGQHCSNCTPRPIEYANPIGYRVHKAREVITKLVHMIPKCSKLPIYMGIQIYGYKASTATRCGNGVGQPLANKAHFDQIRFHSGGSVLDRLVSGTWVAPPSSSLFRFTPECSPGWSNVEVQRLDELRSLIVWHAPCVT